VARLVTVEKRRVRRLAMV